MRLPWAEWEVTENEVNEVAQKFIQANGYHPPSDVQCQVSQTQNPQGFVEKTAVKNVNDSPKPL